MLICFGWTVSNWSGSSNWEEEQKNRDILILPCTSDRELLHMHGWCRSRILASIWKTEKSWCCDLQHIDSYYHALLCHWEGCLPIQVPQCSWLGVWCSSSAIWSNSKEETVIQPFITKKKMLWNLAKYWRIHLTTCQDHLWGHNSILCFPKLVRGLLIY